MDDDLKRLESQIEELNERLRRVENRVFHEAPATGEAPDSRSRIESEEPGSPAVPARGIPATTVLSLIGRSLVILGGAFLLRWLTQSGVLPHKVGSIIGMFYALLWVGMADFKAGRGDRPSAAFHGITGTLIVFPLLVEATTKFHYLTPMLSAIHLAAFIILGLVVAGRRNLRVLAWIVTLPATPLAFVLALRTQATTPFLVSLLILGFVTLWLSYLRHWHVLATLMAGAANLGLSLVVMNWVVKARHPGAEQQASLWEVLFLLFTLIALYFGSYCFRVFKRKRTITALEIGQTLVVVLIGLGGAALVIDAGNHPMLPLGIVSLVLAIACYTAAYGFLPRLDPNRRNFLFYTLLALAMVLLGCEISFARPLSAVVFAAIAFICGALANRIRSPILFLHGAAFLFAAIIRSGLGEATLGGFVGSSPSLAAWGRFPTLITLTVTAVFPLFPRPQGRRADLFLGRRAMDLLLFVTTFTLGAIAVSLVATMNQHGEDAESYRRMLASVRTGALSVATILLAILSGTQRFRNLAWLVYTALLLGAAKLVLVDIAAGGTVTLFLSLGLYGGTLILAPRILHRSSARGGPEPATEG